MQVRVLSFGVLKDSFGAAPFAVELPESATVGDLLAVLRTRTPQPSLAGIAVAVNAEYATATHRLQSGDEVALLPPVSGGAPAVLTYLTREPIDTAALVAEAGAPPDGAVVTFDGIVRNHSRNRPTLHLDYEAYEEMATRQLSALATEALARFSVRHVTVVHRLGRLSIGETSVFIVVASAHRAQAFDACRWLIDTLKKTVPIWKKETFVDGAIWADGEPFPPEVALESQSALESGEHDGH